MESDTKGLVCGRTEGCEEREFMKEGGKVGKGERQEGR